MKVTTVFKDDLLGARILAKCDQGPGLTVRFCGLFTEAHNHAYAVQQLAKKYGVPKADITHEKMDDGRKLPSMQPMRL